MVVVVETMLVATCSSSVVTDRGDKQLQVGGNGGGYEGCNIGGLVHLVVTEIVMAMVVKQ